MGFPNYMGDPSMARVHKYMALDSAEVGYFISQVGAAATCLGVSSSDVSYVAGVLMQYFGYDPMAQCKLYDDGGCYPQPQTAPQCMSSMAPSSYASSSKYEPISSMNTWGQGSKTMEYQSTPTWGESSKTT